MEKLIAVILMAGLSTRFEGPNKQLCLLNGKPVFSYSIDSFSNSKLFDELIIVVNDNNRKEIENYVKSLGIFAKIVIGGATRQLSVENALASFSANENDIVVIHDGARPLVSKNIIKNVIEAAKECGASTTYLEATDTIAVKSENDEVDRFIDRTTIAQIQTPQAFRYVLLKQAHQDAIDNESTDDCSLVLKLGNKIKLVKGEKKLYKVTTKEDINYLEGLLK